MIKKFFSRIAPAVGLGVIAGTVMPAYSESWSTRKTTSQLVAEERREQVWERLRLAHEPHHILARSYRQNMATFAKALFDQNDQADEVDLPFAGAVVAELRRSQDQLKRHHSKHWEAISFDLHSELRAHAERLSMLLNDVEYQLSTLEQELQSVTPDARRICVLASRVTSLLGAMAAISEELPAGAGDLLEPRLP